MTFSWPYQKHAHTSFWGASTSQSNFCEEDFILTRYVAEVVNTITNLTYLYYAYHGIKSNANRQDAILRNLPYLGIAAVGIGSAVFHATLKNYTQWCDDLSMLIAVATVLHRVFTFDKSLKTTVISGVVTAVLMTAFITYHCITDEAVLHQLFFATMIAAVGFKTRSIISQRVSSPEVTKEVKKLVKWGGITFVSGYGIWNLDLIYCSSLTSLKRHIGMPWSFILELHGWWHILTGIGAYTFIALVEYLTSDEAGQPLGNRFAWPVGRIVNGCVGEEKMIPVSAVLDGTATDEKGMGNGKKGKGL